MNVTFLQIVFTEDLTQIKSWMYKPIVLSLKVLRMTLDLSATYSIKDKEVNSN